MFKLTSAFLVATFLLSCTTAEDPLLPCNGNGYNSISTEFYGEWYSIYSGTKIDLNNCTQITIDTVTSTPTQLIVTNIDSKNGVAVSDTWIKRPAVPSTVKVKISSPYRSSNQNYDLCPPQTLGVCAAQVFLTNNQTKEEITATTPTFDTNLETVIPDIPPGEYTLIAEVSDANTTVEVSDTVTINDIETQLGTYNVTDTVESNFKTKIVMDKNFVYGDYETYTGKIITTNIGNSEDNILSYNIDTTHPSIDSANINSIQLGSIPINGTSVSTFSISFKYIDTTFRDITIPVQVTANNQDIWYNTGYIRVYKNKVLVQATSVNPENSTASNGRIRGYLITDNLKYTSLYSPTNIVTESFPYIPNQQHHLILSSNDSTRKIRYSFAFNNEPLSIGALKLPILPAYSSYEPNNSIESSHQLTVGDIIESYADEDDVDSYSIYMPDDPKLHAAVSVVYADHKIYDGNYLDSIGDNDNSLERGETVYLSLGVKNLGASNSSNIILELSSSDQNATIENLTGLYAEQDRAVQLNGLETRGTYHSNDYPVEHPSYLIPTQGFKITINPALPIDQTEIIVTMTATETARGKTYTDTFTIPIK